MAETQQHVDQFAREGLRTLILTEREVTMQEVDEYLLREKQAMRSVVGREDKMCEVYESLEYGMHIVGATGIEDRLQDGVSETIRFIRDAGIKVWVLTGDKPETAVTIGHSSGLLDQNMGHSQIVTSDKQHIQSVLRELSGLKSKKNE